MGGERGWRESDTEKEEKRKEKFSDTFWRTSAMNFKVVVKIAARTRKREKNGERPEGES